jgi:type I restriction enzyme M protein
MRKPAVPQAGSNSESPMSGSTISTLKTDIPRLQTYKKGAGEKIPDWSLLEASVFGTDVSRQMVRISMMNLVLHGIRHAKLKRANSLSDMGGLTEDDLRRRYKVILANPPFAGQLPKDSIRADLPTSSRKSELLFLSLMMQHLAPGGRCAVVVPEGLLFGSTGAHVELRKKLVHDFDLLAVVSLPAGVFKPYAAVKTAVLVFRRPASDAARRVGRLWFYEVKNDGYDPDKISGGGRVETPEKNDIPDLLAQWKAYKTGGFATPPGLEANTVLAHGSAEPGCWWTTREKLAESDFNLGASQWKPRVSEKASVEDPRELVAEVLVDYRQVVAGLEKLMAELPE